MSDEESKSTKGTEMEEEASKTTVIDMEDAADQTQEAPEVDIEGEEGGGAPADKGGKKKAAKVVAAVAAVALLGLGVACSAGAFGPLAGGGAPGSAGSAGSSAVVAGSADAEPEAETVTVALSVSAEGWGEGSSPFIAKIQGETDAGDPVDFAHAVWPDGTGSTVELAPGSYRVGWVSAINGDGSIYRVPDAADLIISSSPASGTTVGSKLEGSFERVPADQVTQEDLDKILGEVADAVEKGDGTLSGDRARDAVDAAAGNAAAAPDADEDAIEDAKGEADKAVEDAKENGGSASTGTGSGSSGKPSGGSTTKPSGGSSGTKPSGSSTTKPSGGSSDTKPSASGGSGSGGSTSKPAHTHSWQAVTTQKWVVDQAAWSEQKYVVDQAAWSEQVKQGSTIKCSCGYSCSNLSQWDSHVQAEISNGNYQHSYSVIDNYVTVNHPEQGHYETVNHPEQGHYETVTTGYKCSGCGATK